ncbi:ATP-binding protein [Magnetospirillum sp. UT-4]|uniref:ATP-binding protein n=1 Tax=Magnetospirillum sp. UT-4 TaxID=2681467 RepID=UPI00137D6709|nr:ATP-binding protein [Magnetospirillum sp. UT-4]CAA7611693.1 hypothetical protein MTBUT4_100051 [Magnetospirillum sp. UT-4]
MVTSCLRLILDLLDYSRTGRHRDDRPRRIAVGCRAEADQWLVWVEDNGMGLAICRKIVEHHHGRIWIEPASDGGTRFMVSLPRLGPST